jgi:hypothetical protein
MLISVDGGKFIGREKIVCPPAPRLPAKWNILYQRESVFTWLNACITSSSRVVAKSGGCRCRLASGIMRNAWLSPFPERYKVFRLLTGICNSAIVSQRSPVNIKVPDNTSAFPVI